MSARLTSSSCPLSTRSSNTERSALSMSPLASFNRESASSESAASISCIKGSTDACSSACSAILRSTGWMESASTLSPESSAWICLSKSEKSSLAAAGVGAWVSAMSLSISIPMSFSTGAAAGAELGIGCSIASLSTGKCRDSTQIRRSDPKRTCGAQGGHPVGCAKRDIGRYTRNARRV